MDRSFNRRIPRGATKFQAAFDKIEAGAQVQIRVTSMGGDVRRAQYLYMYVIAIDGKNWVQGWSHSPASCETIAMNWLADNVDAELVDGFQIIHRNF